MKYLRFLLCFSVIAFIANTTIAKADDNSVRVFINKATETKARVKVESKTVFAPITFAEGASWDNLKDSYTISSGYAALLEKNKAGISIAADGTASFQKLHKIKK
jgi:hypothetical protein